jgi:predicted RNA-binding protein YlqC (UPF0109 family)
VRLVPEPGPLVADLARRLVRRPEAVSVEETRSGSSLSLRLHVDPSDLGAVIGRGGRTAGALRALLGVAGACHGQRIQLEIGE